MFQIKKTDQYLTELSGKYDINRKETKKIIKYFFFNTINALKKGQYIHIDLFGRITKNIKKH